MTKGGTITSAANPLVNEVRRAIAHGSPTRRGWLVAETFHLLEEALRSQAKIHAVLAADSAKGAVEAKLRRYPDLAATVLPDGLFQSIAATETSQGVITLVEPREWRIEDLFGARPLVVLLDGLQDPGNAGTILRTAEAFAATGVMMLKGTVSPHNPKTLRAAAGSLYRLPYLHGVTAAEAIGACRDRRVDLFAAVPAHGGAEARTPAEVDLGVGCALAIGNEARGVSGAVRGAAREVSIPTAGVESLNAAVAAGILLYEAGRRRAMGA